MPAIGQSGHRWSQEHDDSLRELNRNGFSAAQIVTELLERHGLVVSRNAVIGRCHRIKATGMSRQRSPAAAKPRRKPMPTSFTPAERLFDKPETPVVRFETNPGCISRVPLFFAPLPNLDPAIAIDKQHAFLPIPGTSPVTLMNLTFGTCRWPVSGSHERTTLFCGCASQPGKPYCPSHAALARGVGTTAERNAGEKVLA